MRVVFGVAATLGLKKTLKYQEVNMSEPLSSGAQFPELTLKLTEGDSLCVPSDLSTPLNIVLFYRGHW